MLSLLLACTQVTPPAPAVPITVDIAKLGAQERRVDIALLDASAATLVCAGDDDTITLTSPSAAAHTFALYGLLPGTDYTCTITTDTASRDLRLQVGGDPTPLMTPSGAVPPDALLLTGLFEREVVTGDHTAVLIDAAGRRRWSHVFQAGPDVALSFLGDRVLAGGGGLAPTIVTLDHTVAFDAAPILPGWYHHEARQLDDGTLLTLVETVDTDGADTWTGFAVQRIDPATASVVWSWESQTAFDAGIVTPDESIDDDPYHANAASLERIDGRDTVLVNLRDRLQIWAIDVETGALLWRLGEGGDFTLTDPETMVWWGQAHAPELIGETTLTLFENKGQRDSSRSAVRVYRIDVPARTATAVWDWTRTGWSDRAWGDVTTTGPDTTLVTENMRVVEVDQVSGEERWSLTPADAPLLYRSELGSRCALPGRCPE